MGRVGRSACLVVVLVAVLAGCGDDRPADPVGAPVTAPSVADTAPPDTATLRARLLTAADLPAGFAPLADTPDSTEQTTTPDRSRTDPTECGLVLAPIAKQQSGAASDAAVHFGGPDFASVDVDVASYPAGRSAAAFVALQQLLARCAHYSGTDADGIEVDYTIARGSQPAAGDASTSVRIVTTSSGLSLTTDVVLVAVGPTLLQLAATGRQAPDQQVLATLVRTQVQRLRGTPGP